MYGSSFLGNDIARRRMTRIISVVEQIFKSETVVCTRYYGKRILPIGEGSSKLYGTRL